MNRFHVLRRHDGDKEYHAGDVREARAEEVKHLVDLGVLKPAKADTPLKNKVEAALVNKRQPSGAAREAAEKAAAEKAAAEKAAAEKAAAEKAAAEKAAAEKAAAEKAAAEKAAAEKKAG